MLQYFNLKNRKYIINRINISYIESNIIIFIGTPKRTDKYISKWLFALMKKEKEKAIKVKIAICLNTLLKRRKATLNQTEEDIAKSYNKIALDADIRKATVSDTFNGKTMPSSATLILIVETMGFKLNDFSKIYCSIKEDEVKTF